MSTDSPARAGVRHVPTVSDDDRLREAICECIAPGGLALVTVVDRRVRAEVEAIVAAGVLERHPAADHVDRVVDTPRRSRVSRD